MSVGLYMDVHVPRQITRGLRRKGVNVLTAQEDASAELDDIALLDRATHLGRALFSQDPDLLADAARRQRENVAFAGVIYAPQMAMSIGDFIADLELIALAATVSDLANTVLYLPLR